MAQIRHTSYRWLTMPLVLLGCLAVGQVTREELATRLSQRDDMYHVRLVNDRNALIGNLIGIVGDEALETSARIRAIDLLGDFRAVEATETLIDHLVDIRKREMDRANDQFPCLGALIKIGKPGSRAALKEIKMSMPDPRRFLLALVLLSVEGKETGRFMLEEEIKGSRTPEERENLRKVMKYFES